MAWRWVAISVLLALTSPVARAQIYEWRDATGGRHFTNSMEGVPADQHPTTRVVVSEPRRPAELPPSPGPAAPEEEHRQAQVVYDYSNWAVGYAAGVRDGLTMADRSGGSVQINSPLAVTTSRVTESPMVPYYYPFVTTSFDRGRSRHLTLRMLLQDQFQLDRDGPFVFERLHPVGLGPALQPFLPRGLPHGFPQGGRVLFR